MTVFDEYADWYDLFYEDKDYRGEAAFVTDVLRSCGDTGNELLEIGCGTGAHAQWLLSFGWRLVGIDRSERMLARASARLNGIGSPANARFTLGDARNFELGQRFGAAVSLFHVMSYQARSGELDAAMKSARRHLLSGGLFLFDFWYGPAVLAQKPECRVRMVENQRFQVKRTATPTVDESARVVEVHYHFEVNDKQTGTVTEVEEIHPMRYLMPEDLEQVARAAGFTPVTLRAWMGENPPDNGTWSAFAVLRADQLQG